MIRTVSFAKTQYNDLPYKEIAQALKTNENTIKSWVFRGKQILFEMLKEYMGQNK